MYRRWAFWRRAQYVAGACFLLLLVGVAGYFRFFHAPASCNDGRQNGGERGVDCGGSCTRVCALDVMPPSVRWAQAFRVTNGQYNAVAYVENRNRMVGAPALAYTFTLYDTQGAVITTRSGTTVLPPDGVYPIFEGRIATGEKVPVRTFIEIAPVEHWEQASNGRGMFEVRSRTLADADRAPRLSAVVYNTALQEADGVEVVATIFDVRGKALTASQSVVPRIAGRAEAEIVFTWPEPIAKTIRSCEVPTDVMLAIDLSGSMNNDGGTPLEPITSALRAAESFVGLLRASDQAGVVTYATGASLAQGLSSTHTATGSLIRGLVIDPKEEAGETNIGDAVTRAFGELQSSRHNQNARKVLVLLTDGKATGPGERPEEYALAAAAAARGGDVTIVTIGLGAGADDAFLAQIASEESGYYKAATAAELGAIYRKISTALCEEGAAVIDVIPKTPLK